MQPLKRHHWNILSPPLTTPTMRDRADKHVSWWLWEQTDTNLWISSQLALACSTGWRLSLPSRRRRAPCGVLTSAWVRHDSEMTDGRLIFKLSVVLLIRRLPRESSEGPENLQPSLGEVDIFKNSKTAMWPVNREKGDENPLR